MRLLEILLWICIGATVPFVVLFIAAVCVVAGRESRKEEKDGTSSDV